jgi:purine-nucleoside phosphorylase
MTVKDRASEAAEFLRSHTTLRPRIALIVGTALGDLVDSVTDRQTLLFEDVPHVKPSTVASHDGQFVIGKLGDVEVVLMSGRLHYYEGYEPVDVAFPVNVLKEFGVHTLIVTNASGAINESYRVGEIMMISDHLNFTGINPLRGADTSMGRRYPDLTDAYSAKLRQLAHSTAQTQNIPLEEGTYAWMVGPSLETPAEIRGLRVLGGDAVGMSTVPEVITANYVGIEVLAFACLTNMAAGMTGEDEFADSYIHDNGATAARNLAALLLELIPQLDN